MFLSLLLLSIGQVCNNHMWLVTTSQTAQTLHISSLLEVLVHGAARQTKYSIRVENQGGKNVKMENNQQNGRTDSATLMCILTVTFQINGKNLVYWITIYCLQETHLKKKKKFKNQRMERCASTSQRYCEFSSRRPWQREYHNKAITQTFLFPSAQRVCFIVLQSVKYTVALCLKETLYIP